MTTKYKLKPKTFLFAFSVLAALLILIANLNKPVLWPQTSLRIDTAGAVGASPEGMVIIDRQYTRLLFLNARQELVNVLNLKETGAPVDEAYLANISNGRVFISGCRLLNAGWYFSSGHILEYDLGGNLVRKIYQHSFAPNEYVSFPLVSRIEPDAAGNVLAEVLWGRQFARMHITDKESPSMQYVEAADVLRSSFPLGIDGDSLVEGTSGLWYLFRDSVTELLPISEADARRYLLKNYQLTLREYNILFDGGSFPKMSMVSQTSRSDGKHLYHIKNNWELADYSYTSGKDVTIKDIPLAPQLLFRVFSFWAAALYLLLIILRLLGKILHHLHSGAAVLILSNYLKTALAILFVTALITGFYTKVTYDRYRQEAETGVMSQLAQVEDIIRCGYSDVLDGVKKQGTYWYQRPEHRERLIKLRNHLQSFTQANGKDSSYYAHIFLADVWRNNYCTLIDTSSWNAIGEQVKKTADRVLKQQEGVLYEEKNQSDHYICGNRFFRDEQGKVFAVLETGCLLDNILARQQKEAINNFFSLLAVLTGLYLLKLCAGSFMNRIELYRSERRQGKTDAWCHLTGLLNFLYGIAMEIDSVLGVFVIRAMLPGASIGEVAFFAALPMPFFVSGVTIFYTFIGKWFFSRFSVRMAGLIGGSLATVSFLLLSVAVKLQSLPLFFAAKLFSGMTFEAIAYYLIYFCSMSIKDDKRRYALNYEGVRFRGVSMVMAMLGGVYIAETFGYSFIYFIALISSLLITLILFLAGPSVCVLDGNGAAGAAPATAGKSFFLSRPGLLTSATLLVVSLFVRVYGSYIFPLCAAAADLSPIFVTNIFVLAKAISIAFSDKLMQLKSRLPSELNNILSLTFNSLLLLAFFLSPSFSWSVIVLFIIVINFSEADISSYLAELAARHGFPIGEMLIHFSFVNTPLYIIRGSVLSAMVVFSIYTTAAVIGGAGLLLVSLYSWCSRNSVRKTFLTDF